MLVYSVDTRQLFLLFNIKMLTIYLVNISLPSSVFENGKLL